MIPIVAQTRRTILVNLIDILEQDYPTNYRAWFHDPEVTEHNSHGLFPYTEASMEDFKDTLRQGKTIVWGVLAKKGPKGEPLLDENNQPIVDEKAMAIVIRYGIIHLRNGTTTRFDPPHIGNITLQRFDWINRSAEMAVVFGEKDYWGQGYATETLTALYDHGFAKLNLHRIWSGTSETNEGMVRVFEKLYMKHEGTFRDGAFLNGAYRDVLEYAILEEEWWKRGLNFGDRHIVIRDGASGGDSL